CSAGPPRLARQNHADRASRGNGGYLRRCPRSTENRRCGIGVIPKRFRKGQESLPFCIWRRKPPAGHTGGTGNHLRGGFLMQVSHRALVVSVVLASLQLLGQGKELPMEHPTFYRTAQIDGLSIFYREAGPKDAPTILLLHGLPSSSRIFDPLFAGLSDRYHLVAPDYPGFGHSDWPDPKKFAYTFDHYAEIMNHFTEALGLSRYTLYMQDYGGPVGF